MAERPAVLVVRRVITETDEGRELRKWFASLPREEQKRLYFEALASRGSSPPKDR